MKLLHIIPTYKPAYTYGGTVTAISLLCENLVAKGNCEVTVLSTTANGDEDLPIYKIAPKKMDGVDVYYFKRLTREPMLWAPDQLRFLWKNIDAYDAVHIHSWWNLPSLLSIIICLIKGVKPVFSPHGMLSPFSMKGKIKPIFHRVIGKWILKNTFLFTTSQQEAKECLTLIPDWQHCVLPNFIDLESLVIHKSPLHEARTTNNSPINLLFLSRLHPKKGAELLFDALAKAHFNWTLKMAGGGETDYLNQLKTRSKNLKIADKIQWIGWVNAEQRRAAFVQADLLVLPSYNENFALVVIESLAVGTPVLVSKYVGISDYVAENNLGWVCDTTVESIVENLTRAYLNLTERQKISERSGAQIQKDFDPTHLAQLYIANYKSLTHLQNLNSLEHILQND